MKCVFSRKLLCIFAKIFEIYHKMNLYIRYFDQERLFVDFDEALAFLSTFEGYSVTQKVADDLRAFLDSDNMYPRRFKVSSRSYYIAIKSEATSLDEFHEMAKKAVAEPRKEAAAEPQQQPQRPLTMHKIKETQLATLAQECPGWYAATLTFKRVIVNPETGKFSYVDTPFSVRTKAYCPQDCYDRIIAHLQSRPDIDPRSQFPAARGKNFAYEYLGFNPEPITVEPAPQYEAAPVLQDYADDFIEDL